LSYLQSTYLYIYKYIWIAQKSTVVYITFQGACIGTFTWHIHCNNYVDIQLLIVYCMYVLQLCNCICATSHAMLLHYCKYLLQSHEIHFYKGIRHCSLYICILSSNTYVRHYVNIYMKVYIAVLSSKEKKLLFIKKDCLQKRKRKVLLYICLASYIYRHVCLSDMHVWVIYKKSWSVHYTYTYICTYDM